MNKEFYAGVDYLSDVSADMVLCDAIDDEQSFLAGRIGGTEIKTIYAYSNPFRSLKDFRIYSNTICELSGFFPKNPVYIKRFCKAYIQSMYDIDYLGAFNWPGEEIFMKKSTVLKCSFPSKVFDPLVENCSWYQHLEGKRVLIIHPFEKTIINQYEKREQIVLGGGRILPKFELLTVKAVQSLGGKGAKGFRNWFEALDHMKKQIDTKEFDIALLGCGAYGIPLGSYIKKKGKQAIYVGGCLQLLFGIMGARWENEERVTKAINEYWTRPLEEDRIQEFDKIEGGCYW